MSTANDPQLLEHLFRHQAGRLVAHLTKLLGPARLDLAEEAVQEAMVRALQTWPYSGAPENAPAWLFRVARNAAFDVLRRNKTADEKAGSLIADFPRSTTVNQDDLQVEEELRDDELRMIIMCCHPSLSREASVALSLKTVGGFSVREIARAFFCDETTIAQRLVRAKRQIRERRLSLEVPQGHEVDERLDSVMDVIYFMFNEGYAAHEGQDLVRQDLCLEAIRLGRLVAASSLKQPRVDALVALMAFLAARLPARVDEAGDMILLEFQDRSKWNQELIAMGFHHFDQSISGNIVSPYHVQAAIAATHARAITRDSTDWHLILELYDQLFALTPSPVVALNRVVVIGKVYGPEIALAAIEPLQSDSKLQDYYLLAAVRAHLLLELGRREEAAGCYRAALQQRCSEPERRFLQRKLIAIESLSASAIANSMNRLDRIRFRRAQTADAAALCELAIRTYYETFAAANTPENMQAYLSSAFTVTQFDAAIADSRVPIFVAETGAGLIAYAKLVAGRAPECVSGETPIELERLYVDSQWQGTGVAATLMELCLAEARHNGCKTIYLGVWEKNARAQAFYRKWGFQRVGEHVFQMGDDAQIDWWMARSVE